MDKKEEYYYSKAEGDLCDEAVALHHHRYQEVGFIKQKNGGSLHREFNLFYCSNS